MDEDWIRFLEENKKYDEKICKELKEALETQEEEFKYDIVSIATGKKINLLIKELENAKNKHI